MLNRGEQNMAILFIEDDEFRSMALREGLSIIGGYEVDFVESAHKAVLMFSKTPYRYELIITDILMPHNNQPVYRDFSIDNLFSDNRKGMYTGFKVILQIKAICKKLEIEPKIMVHSNIDDKTIAKILKTINVNVSRIIAKPRNLEYFLKEVKDVLQNSSSSEKK